MRKAPFELSELAIFLALSQNKSMALTAAQFGIKQPTVSQTIKKLEEKLGEELFDRSFKPMRLTAAGEALAKRSSGLLEDAANIAQDVTRGSDAKRSISIACTDAVNNSVLAGAIGLFTGAASRIDIDIGKGSYVSQRLVEGVTDIAISTQPLTEFPEIRALPVVREKMVLLTPKGVRVPEDAAGLDALARKTPFLSLYPSFYDYLSIENYLKRSGVHRVTFLRTNSHYFIFEAVAKGLGWSVSALMNIFGIKESLSEINVSGLPGNFTRTLYVLYRDEASAKDAEMIRRYIQEAVIRDFIPWASRFVSTPFVILKDA